MNNTYQILLNWDKGSTFAERLSAKILDIEGYENIDPQCPTGGPDGGKDILCEKDEYKYIAGCYFPNGQQNISDIKKKFSDDYQGLTKNNANRFIFITNQKISLKERGNLCQDFPSSTIYHGEKVCGVLDSPRGYGVRLEYLGIELSKEEQISFLNYHINLEKHFKEIKESLSMIEKATNLVAGYCLDRDLESNSKLSVLPIAGIQLSSRISIEDIKALHVACLYEGGRLGLIAPGDFRKIDVWIGSPGCKLESADFVPLPPEQINRELNKLLEWWRDEYMNVVYSEPQSKILAIAKFHEQFLSIHPFLDGNGRVIRVISSIQYKDLLGELLKFEKMQNLGEYYNALQLAQNNDHNKLVDIFMSLAE